HQAEAAVERGLQDGLGSDYRAQILPAAAEHFTEGIEWRSIAVPFPLRHPQVERVRNIAYVDAPGHRLRLDVYTHRDRPTACTTLAQGRGGGWVAASRHGRGPPLGLPLASPAWAGASADSRRTRRASFPEPLTDLKHALRWIREQGPAYGVDPDFVVVTGGSAGGHLAALVALTANDPAYQPGFEHVDTSVRACVAFYGVYDFTDRF